MIRTKKRQEAKVLEKPSLLTGLTERLSEKSVTRCLSLLRRRFS